MKYIPKIACLLAMAVAPALAHADILLTSSCTTVFAGEVESVGDTNSSLQQGLTDTASGQVVQFSGTSTASADYGALHSTSAASITNDVPYINGTGATGASYSSAQFEDTLNFAGTIPNGYHAQYYFLVQGTLSHTGAQTGSDSGSNATIDFSVNDNYDQGRSYDVGPHIAGNNTVTINDLWMPVVVDLDGATSQDVVVTLMTEAVVNTNENVNGANFSYNALFQDTLTLAGIDVVDSSGNSLDPSLWSVDASSGTQYPIGIPPAPVPEPATLGIASLSVLMLVSRRRHRK